MCVSSSSSTAPLPGQLEGLPSPPDRGLAGMHALLWTPLGRQGGRRQGRGETGGKGILRVDFF